MKRNNIIQNIQSLNLSLVRLLLFLGVFGIMMSCEIEDDLPPPSAYVAPEPVEGCVQIEGVPVLPEGIDFECLYPEIGTFGETDDAAITVEPVDNPYQEGINTSEKVMMVTQEAGVLGYAGLYFDVASKIDFSEKQSIKIKVYSPAAGQTILLKLEDSSDSSLNTEVSTTTTVADEWEELSFTFSPGDSEKYEKMVLFFNFNGDKDAASVHYFDDIVLGEAGPADDPMKLPVTFDEPLVNYNVVAFGAEDTGFEIVSNPNLSGTNDTESQVGAITKTGAAYEGATFNLSEPLDLSGENKTLSVKVYSEVAYTVLLKLETGVNDERSNEVSADHGGTGWETLTFNFATDAKTSYQSESDPGGEAIVPNGQYDQISLFLDLAGSATGTFYVDDLVYVEGDGGTSAAPNEAAPTPTTDAANVLSIYSDSYTDPADANYYPAWNQSTAYEEIDFSGNKLIKYSNLNYQGIEFGETFDLSGFTTLSIDVWSGDYTSIPVFLISQGSGEKSVSLDLTPNQWNTIEIPLSDFTDQGLDISDIFQIKFAVESAGGTFYLDNLYFSNEVAADCVPETAENIDPANGPINWTFLTDDPDHEFDAFGDVTTDIVSNPKTDGINPSCSVQMIEKTVGCQTWSGLGQAIATPIDFTTTDKKVFKLKVLAKDQLAAVTLRLEKEPHPDVEPAEDRVAEITELGVWQELTFDFSDVDDKTFRSIIIYFERNAACDGDVYYFDDLKQVAGGDGGGTDVGTELSQIDLPVDFESSTVDYTLTDFGDNMSSIVVDPTDASNTVAKVIKLSSAQTWAGTTIGKDSGFATNIPITLTNSKMTVRVWSPEVGTPIRLKLEDSNDATHTVETEVNTTLAGDWETLEFDFTNEAPGTESLSVGLNNGWVYNKASIFFNFGTDGATAGEKTYYFDDVLFIE